MGSPFGQDLRQSCPEKRPIVRSAASSGGGFGAAEFHGVVGFEEPDEKLVGVFSFEIDDLAAVVDRFGNSFEGDGSGLFFELEGVVLLDGGESLAVGLRDPHRVVVEFAGDTGLGGGDPDDAVGPKGLQERFLRRDQRFGHGENSCF